MVTQAGYYFGTLFKCYQAVTHSEPLPPTIFNMVVDYVIRHWVMMFTREEAGPEGFRRVVQWIAKKF